MTTSIHATRLIRFAILSAFAVIGLSLLGCGASRAIDAATPPEHLTLQLRMAGKDNKYTYFELDRDGQLSFGGGRMAMMRGSKPVTTLSAEQLQAVWDVIRKHKLLEAGSELFPDIEEVRWDLLIRTDSILLGRTIRSSDDTVPGIKELHDLLFEFQAEVRYRDLGTGN